MKKVIANKMAAPNEQFTEVDLPLISRNQLTFFSFFFKSEQTNNWAEQRMAFTKSKYKVIERKEG